MIKTDWVKIHFIRCDWKKMTALGSESFEDGLEKLSRFDLGFESLWKKKKLGGNSPRGSISHNWTQDCWQIFNALDDDGLYLCYRD